MVREKDLRVYGLRGRCGLFGSHGVGLVDRQESDVDIFDIFHFRDGLGVACDIDAEAVYGQDVAVVATIGMEFLPALGRVVGGNSLDFDLFAYDLGFAVGKGRAGAVELFDRRVKVDLRPLFLQKVYGILVIVVEMLVSDENEVGLGEFGIIRGGIHLHSHRINMDLLAVVLNAHGGVLDGGDGHIFAICGLEGVGILFG